MKEKKKSSKFNEKNCHKKLSIRNNRISPTKARNGLSHECGENASAKVIRMGIAIKATMNWIGLNKGPNTIIVINEVIKTQALPSTLRSYFFFENKA